MPTKHIDDQIWRSVEKKTVEAVIKLQKPVKETVMLKWLIEKGLETLEEKDLEMKSKAMR